MVRRVICTLQTVQILEPARGMLALQVEMGGDQALIIVSIKSADIYRECKPELKNKGENSTAIKITTRVVDQMFHPANNRSN